MTLAPKLIELLACPACHGALREGGLALICEKCSKSYPVEGGIPNFV